MSISGNWSASAAIGGWRKQSRGTVRLATGRLCASWAASIKSSNTRNRDAPDWLDPRRLAALPETIRVRELRYQSTRPAFGRGRSRWSRRCWTRRVSADDLAGLYRRRWEIETNFGHLKTTMGMDVLRCHSVAGVLKELTMFALVYNLVRLVMLAAAETKPVPLAQISFVDALRWLAEACHTNRLD